MTMLGSNADLYHYMQTLTLKLGQRGSDMLSDLASNACRYAASSGAELLGESRIALCRILQEESGILTAQERSDMLEVVKQIDDASNKRK